MDVAQSLQAGRGFIHCIDMHTTGEPTRIIYSGYPELTGTLLQQRDQARQHYDHIRKRLMLEPRGHDAMYGAILRPTTEYVSSSEADIGVLFTHNEGYSTMCGHATIALGRFLVDTHDLSVFPRREQLGFNRGNQTVTVRIHAPCGIVTVTVPATEDGRKSDPSRLVSFQIEAWIREDGYGLKIPIPSEIRWPELAPTKTFIEVDVSYGGAFYAIIDVKELGFNTLNKVDLNDTARCMEKLKPYLSTRPEVQKAVQHPSDKRLSFLYGVMIVEKRAGFLPDDKTTFAYEAETGLCYFADNQIDRSPTGSCVAARMALAPKRDGVDSGHRVAYNSLVSNRFQTDAFIGELTRKTVAFGGIDKEDFPGWEVRIEGRAFYIGTSTFVVEEGDVVSAQGFTLEEVAK